MRIIIKDLPQSTKKEELQKEFQEYGNLTDIYMVENKMGKFRRTAFLGYEKEEEAEMAIKSRNNSFFKKHKIKVEKCKNNSSKLLTQGNATIERKILYSKEVFVRNLSNIDELTVKKEVDQYGRLLGIKQVENGLYLKFKMGEDALNFHKTVKFICGKRIKSTAYNEEREKKMETYYNSLFFDFKMVAKNACELENMQKEEVIDMKSSKLGTKMALLEADLVEKTKKFLLENGIDFTKKITRSKTRLIIRNSDILSAIDLIKGDFTVEISPSRCLALIEFPSANEAEKTHKFMNFKRLRNEIIYSEFSPEKNTESFVEEEKKSNHLVNNKICIKNLPFQTKEEEIKELFKHFAKVIDVRIPRKADGTSRGFCFLTVDSERNVDKILECFSMSTHLYGRKLILQKAIK
ncbi:hypothetical protein NUSPORA_00609 [Nucleospora cyclopteri]